MINRVLIRMKAVQLLYSYLLVEKPFSLESQPTSPTKEKRFAWTLYLEMIYLMDRLAHEVKGKNKSFPLANSRFILRAENDDKLRSLISKYETSESPFKEVQDSLKESIRESLLFQEFEKNREKGIPTDNFWENVFKSIIIPSVAVNEVIRNMPGYTLSGLERMKDMMDETFRNFYATRDNVDDALKNLEKSLQKARDLYMLLLALPVDLTKLRKEQLEQNRRKYLAGVEDLNPNMKFVNNKIPKFIEENPVFSEYVEKNHLSWFVEDPELLKILLKVTLESELYQDYLRDVDSQEKDSEFWQSVIVEIFMNNQDFLEYLENKSVFWNDDLEIMSSFVVKTLKRMEKPDTKEDAVLPMYKDGEKGEDARFGSDLIGYVVRNKELYKRYIDEVLQHEKWESDRLAFMDVVIVMTALAEIINYPEIPLTVSINEYIEIAKSYSSAKSGQFVHGLLASLISRLKEEGVIYK